MCNNFKMICFPIFNLRGRRYCNQNNNYYDDFYNGYGGFDFYGTVNYRSNNYYNNRYYGCMSNYPLPFDDMSQNRYFSGDNYNQFDF